MRLKERIDDLEFRLEAVESALRMVAGTAGVGRIFDDPAVAVEMVEELTADLMTRFGPDLDAESAAEEAQDLVDRLRWLLAAPVEDAPEA